MKTIELSPLSIGEKQAWLNHAIGPRPIAFVSTVDAGGNANLSPFSFFNLFSYDPSVVIFSTVRKVRDNSIKHTLENLLQVPEAVINICDINMVQQVSLASGEYPKGVDEFIKAGFTKQPATLVQPPMVKEAGIKLECRVMEVKSLGEHGGAGQLVIAEVLLLHVDESLLNDDGNMIDQLKTKHVSRMGGNWYAAINETNLFTVPRPGARPGIGFDGLPQSIRNSNLLTGNNLAMLAGVAEIPVVNAGFEDNRLKNIVQYYAINPDEMEKELHLYAKELLEQNRIEDAWQVLLYAAG
ncbi:flavin reductase family protein [Foetidibacter luteolus]|uniref:flavin reductase family protein n=1 Tax=Foetidibacter luteolus TaxID=2608880 RepID=UPI00129BC5B4|nr:flavin reductase family protein [Foetidibacter luteolus]